MGLIKKIRKVGSKIGGVLKKGAPLLGLIPGVGTLAGAGLGALGSVMEGNNGWGGTLKAGALGGLSGLGNTTLLGGKGALGIPGALSKATAGMKVGRPAAGKGGAIDKIASAARGLIPRTKSGGIDLGSLLGLGLGGYAAVTGNKYAAGQRRKQELYTGKQLGIADEIGTEGRSLNASAGRMRTAAEPGLLARLAAGPRQAPSFAGRFTDNANPFAKNFGGQPPAAPRMALPGSMPGAQPPMPPQQPPPGMPALPGAPPMLALPPGLQKPRLPSRLPFPLPT